MRKIVSFVLILSMLLTFSLGSVFAAKGPQKVIVNDIEVEILQDDKNFRVARSEDDTYITEVTYNKKTDEVYMKILDTNNGQVLYDSNETFITPLATEYENTFVNYEYSRDIQTNLWTLRRPNTPYVSSYYFKTYQTSKNATYLQNFKSHVEEINVKEIELIGALGASIITTIAANIAGVITIFTGGTATPAMIAALAAAVGAYGTTAVILTKYVNAMEDAYASYFDVFYNSSVFY